MKGGLSDCLTVGFDMAEGDDKACLTVMRRRG